MKTYNIRLMTKKGLVSETYTDSLPLEEFQNSMIEKHGTFFTYSSNEVTD